MPMNSQVEETPAGVGKGLGAALLSLGTATCPDTWKLSRPCPLGFHGGFIT